MFEGLRFQHWQTARGDDGIVVLSLDRAGSSVNALSRAVLDELAEIVERLSFEPPRGVIVRSAKSGFIVGADIKEFEGFEKSGTVQDALENGQRVFQRLASLPCPTVAAIHGVCMGGGTELALACDIAIAGESAKFGVPEVKLGAIPGAGGTQRLVHAIGKSKAMALLLTGDFMDARKACDVGIVAEVTADGQALPTALAMARRIAANSPLAVALAKDAALASFETPLAQGLEHEKRNFVVALRSADNLEGQAAFLAKRTPQFTGQ